MRNLIIEALIEAVKSPHWKRDSYPVRILDSSFRDLPKEYKEELDKRVEILESMEFDTEANDNIGVWLYTAPKTIYYPPFRKIDKGHLLLAIIKGNNLVTLFWKHMKGGDYDYDITFEKLVEFTKSPYYDKTTAPINIKNIKRWESGNNQPQTKQPTYKKIKTKSGVILKYYRETKELRDLQDNMINVDDVYNDLPDDILLDIIND
jgi:hypothetical protein